MTNGCQFYVFKIMLRYGGPGRAGVEKFLCLEELLARDFKQSSESTGTVVLSGFCLGSVTNCDVSIHVA